MITVEHDSITVMFSFYKTDRYLFAHWTTSLVEVILAKLAVL